MDRPVFIYSEKCDYCRNLNNMLKENPVIYGSMTLHNIDVNRNIPKSVKSVPTILFGNKIFSGNNAFAWVNEQIKYFNAQQAQQQGQQGQQGQGRGISQQQQTQQAQRSQQMQQAQQIQSTQRGQQTHMGQQPGQAGQQGQQGPMAQDDGGLEAYCDENGICGANLELLNGNKFNGSEDGSVKSKIGNYMSVDDYASQEVKVADQRR